MRQRRCALCLLLALCWCVGCKETTHQSGVANVSADSTPPAMVDAGADAANNDVRTSQTDSGSDATEARDTASNDSSSDGPEFEDTAVEDDACLEQCEGGFACVDGVIFACDETAPCGLCGCEIEIEAPMCSQPCVDGERADSIEGLCDNDCLCVDDDGCDAGSVCQDCQCIPRQQPECQTLCAARADSGEMSGFCPFEYLSEIPCETFCTDLRARFSQATAAALDQCIETDPLCFQDVNDCIFAALYGDEADITITLRARGFDDYEGMAVYGVIQEGNRNALRIGPLTIVDGEWTMTFNHTAFPANQENVYLYIDVNGDERCDPETDVTTVGYTVRGQDYENPTYEGELMPDGRSFDFVCPLFN